jgi:hypothetical protein
VPWSLALEIDTSFGQCDIFREILVTSMVMNAATRTKQERRQLGECSGRLMLPEDEAARITQVSLSVR